LSKIFGGFQAAGSYSLGVFGNSGRNTLRGPGLKDLDVSVSRNFAILERIKLQFRAEAFNLTNTVAFGLPKRECERRFARCDHVAGGRSENHAVRGTAQFLTRSEGGSNESEGHR
jgi:hypothetical protein